MPLPQEYLDECLYRPEAWFLRDAEVDLVGERVIGVIDTTKLGPLVDAQRVWPGHPKHVPGAVMIQVTGILGQVWAVCGLGLRATDGWSGFGTHIDEARFLRIGEIGPEVHCEMRHLGVRRLRDTIFTKASFSYRQGGAEIFRSKQSAAWVLGPHRGPLNDELCQGGAGPER